jgi:hypothetical protein
MHNVFFKRSKMLHSIGQYTSRSFVFLEKGLANPSFLNPSFLGRAVSWGIFYGAVAVVVAKIIPYAVREFKKIFYKKNVVSSNNQHTVQTIRGDKRTPSPQTSPRTLNKKPPRIKITPENSTITPHIHTGITPQTVKTETPNIPDCPDTPVVTHSMFLDTNPSCSPPESSSAKYDGSVTEISHDQIEGQTDSDRVALMTKTTPKGSLDSPLKKDEPKKTQEPSENSITNDWNIIDEGSRG